MPLRLLAALFLSVSLSVFARGADSNLPVNPLTWDALEKTLEVKPGDGAADFEFHVTNTSDKSVEILDIRPSCGCTVAEMPSTPWVLAPGAKGSFRGTIDFSGKHGRVAKTLSVSSSAGTQLLGIVVNLPQAPGTGMSRESNQ